jgi:hypothetical protein
MSRVLSLFVLSIVVLVSGCQFTSKGEPPHPDQERTATKYFMDVYSEKLIEVQTKEYKKSYIAERFNKPMKFAGVAYTEKDPSLGVQFYIDGNGKVIDVINKKQHDIRIKIQEILNRYRPDNPVGEYFAFEPGGIDGPFLSSGGDRDTTLEYGILLDSTDSIKEELRKDYNIAAEVQNLYHKSYPNTKGNSFGVNIAYYVKGDYSLSLWMKNSEWGQYWNDQINRGRMVLYLDKDNEQGKGYFTKEIVKPKRILQYDISEELPDKSTRDIGSLTFEQYLGEIRKQTAEHVATITRTYNESSEGYRNNVVKSELTEAKEMANLINSIK